MPPEYLEDAPKHEETPPLRPPYPPIPPGPQSGPPKKKGLGCGIWLLIAAAVFFFGCTLVLLLALVGAMASRDGLDVGGGAATHRFMEQTVEGTGPDKVLLIPIAGIIADLPRKGIGRSERGLVSTVRQMLKRARKDPAVKAVILAIDSPGGGITASDVLYHELATFRKETGLPMVALLGDVAASGGYYVAAAAQHIIAHPTTVTGSVGVVMPLLGIQDLLKKIGVEVRPIKSGQNKDIGAMYRGMSAEERAMLQSIVDEYHERFVSVVHEGFRLRAINMTREELEKHCDGRVFTGKQAKELGFVDGIGYFKDAVRAARERAGLAPDTSRVVTYQRKPTLLDLIFARTSAPQADAITIHLGGLRPNGESPRFLYLWQVGQSGLPQSPP